MFRQFRRQIFRLSNSSKFYGQVTLTWNAATTKVRNHNPSSMIVDINQLFVTLSETICYTSLKVINNFIGYIIFSTCIGIVGSATLT